MLAQIKYTPSAVDPLLPAELSAAELYEYELLSIPEDNWSRFALTLNEKGDVLTSVDDQGKLVINDPVLAEWDAKARANAEAMEKKLAEAFEVKVQ